MRWTIATEWPEDNDGLRVHEARVGNEAPISDDVYLRLLDEAFYRVFEYRDLETISAAWDYPRHSPDPTAGRRMLSEALNEFNQLESAARNLEEIRPRSAELMDVHVATIGYLRAALLQQDRFTMGIIEGLQGLKGRPGEGSRIGRPETIERVRQVRRESRWPPARRTQADGV